MMGFQPIFTDSQFQIFSLKPENIVEQFFFVSRALKGGLSTRMESSRECPSWKSFVLVLLVSCLYHLKNL